MGASTCLNTTKRICTDRSADFKIAIRFLPLLRFVIFFLKTEKKLTGWVDVCACAPRGRVIGCFLLLVSMDYMSR